MTPPGVWLTDMLARTADSHSINRIEELLPWVYRTADR
ncbi:transposase domain-containing protein [Mesorhizobium tianshanense]